MHTPPRHPWQFIPAYVLNVYTTSQTWGRLSARDRARSDRNAYTPYTPYTPYTHISGSSEALYCLVAWTRFHPPSSSLSVERV